MKVIFYILLCFFIWFLGDIAIDNFVTDKKYSALTTNKKTIFHEMREKYPNNFTVAEGLELVHLPEELRTRWLKKRVAERAESTRVYQRKLDQVGRQMVSDCLSNNRVCKLN